MNIVFKQILFYSRAIIFVDYSKYLLNYYNRPVSYTKLNDKL